MTSADHYRTWDAAYVLGALSTDDRREYEGHLSGCGGCRSAVAELDGMPGLLSLLDLDEVIALDHEQPAPPLRPEVLTSVIDRMGARRRRARRATVWAVAVAAALLALAIVLAVRPAIFGSDGGGEQTAPMQNMAKVSETPINASIALTGYGWGTRIDMACSYGDWGQNPRGTPPQNLGMVVIGHDGSRSQIATWLGLSGATALPSGTTPMQVDEIRAVQLVSASDGEVLLEKQW
ncbi:MULTISPECIES: anti-sigma factor family protein [Mycolicibacterium]|uniref:Putative transmembrane anti-sigma factor n=2 Tax=Mycolicibacterium gilvum TaxID=1804 RepID=A0A378SIM4_9MYCO|nr:MULTISPECIES: zf-HC2 domain-containing protein [Mycolicibacterium]ABP47484.1 putative transmembrane anti-sigma factor [Mycolicibacterium gilvum PYR-GCK]MBV5242544.1 zf-HC2 domain-containing protein [Mycolicibacterium sp. PAM1]MCV7058644.1 zf-HC2 domain-containing protein [Mycolicibacterium gilvum]STZ41988.1 putative transmembrane anti-sigma factor [Mycolicibacterium gilvum]